MITLDTACRLKAAGLPWQPKLHDFFAIPDRDLDEYIFVLSDVQATVDILFGRQVVSFQGASEWALDSLLTEEAVWMPREEQLREILEVEMLAVGQMGLQFFARVDGYRVFVQYQGQKLEFHAQDASEAYAKGVFFMLEHRPPSESKIKPDSN